MEMNDLIAIKEMLNDDDHKCGCYDDCYHRRIKCGTATALAGGFAALGIVIFGGLGLYAYASQANKNAYQLSNMTNQRINDTIGAVGQLNNALLQEAANRQNNESAMRGEYTSAASKLNDQISITNSTATSANSAANSWANAEASIVNQVLTGNFSKCPQAVSIYSAPQPCGCVAPACGCGCNS